jgi:hypothetical protein
VNITISWPQLLKLRALGGEDLKRLHAIVLRGGSSTVSPADKLLLRNLTDSRLLKAKAGKAWVAFDVNGVRPAPFVGNARVSPEAPTDMQQLSRTFCKLYRRRYGESYGSFEKLDWTFIARMAREVTVDEFGAMAAAFFGETARSKATVATLYAQRQRLRRGVSDSGLAHRRAFDTPEEGEVDGGW